MHWRNILIIVLAFLGQQAGAQTEKLFETAKVWGFVKYHYQSDENIHNELGDLVENRLSLDDFVARYDSLFQADKPPLHPIKTNNKDSTMYCLSNDWIDGLNSISNATKMKLLQQDSLINKYECKNIEQNNKKWYKNEYSDSFKDSATTETTELLGIFTMWNYLNYFYPHRCNLSSSYWDEVLSDAIKLYHEKPRAIRYHQSLLYLAGKLNDLHHLLYNYNTKPSLFLMEEGLDKTIDIDVVEKDSNLVVVYSNNKYFQKYDTIFSINKGKPNAYLRDFYPYLDKEYRDEFTFINLSGNNLFGVKRDKVSINLRVDSTDLIPVREWWLQENRSMIDSSLISDHYEYIGMDAIKSKKDLKTAKAAFAHNGTILFDLRVYPVNNVLTYNFARNIIGKFSIYNRCPNFSHPGVFMDKKWQIRGKYQGDKKILILVDNRTASWPEFYVMLMMQNNNTYIMGTQTGNAMGVLGKGIRLPGNILYYGTQKKGEVTNQHQSYYPKGISPDYRLPNAHPEEKDILEVLDKLNF